MALALVGFGIRRAVANNKGACRDPFEKSKSPGFGSHRPGLLTLRAQRIGCALVLIGQRPTLPHTRACSTIGAAGLNYRVRDGNGWDPCATITQK